MSSFQLLPSSGVPIKAFTNGVPVEDKALEQLRMTAELPIVHGWVAVMPDVHWGLGATVGSVIPTRGAIVPAAVGVDIGCGMSAVRTNVLGRQLPDALAGIRSLIEDEVPVGRACHHGLHNPQQSAWKALSTRYERLMERYPSARVANPEMQLGTLGGGNHFIELCLDEDDQVWVMLHSGSRGMGNRIGSVFIEAARREMERLDRRLPHRDLAWLDEGTELFDDYVGAVALAQTYAAENRRLMMDEVFRALVRAGLPLEWARVEAVDCHHNYISRETHAGAEVWVTRKGAVRADAGRLGIIPGSMGAKSFIVRGRGNPDGLESCSHGAGRTMSRTAAKKMISMDDHLAAVAGVECRRDEALIDESPAAYKPIEAVMKAQEDLVEIVATLRQVVCVKG